MTALPRLAEAWAAMAPHLWVLMGLLLIAAVIDWRCLRIPNVLTGGGTLLALLLSLSPSPGALGVTSALAGLALGLALLLPMYLLGVMGAGDVKLMAMTGAYLGAPATLLATLFVVLTAGVLALGLALARGRMRPLLHNLQTIVILVGGAPAGGFKSGLFAGQPSVGKLPYGVSICLGTGLSLLLPQLRWL